MQLVKENIITSNSKVNCFRGPIQYAPIIIIIIIIIIMLASRLVVRLDDVDVVTSCERETGVWPVQFVARRRPRSTLIVVDRHGRHLPAVMVRPSAAAVASCPGRCGNTTVSLAGRVNAGEVEVGVDGADDGAEGHQHE